MELEIKVIPNARKERVCPEEAPLKVYVTAAAVDGKANHALIQVLAKHFSVKPRQVAIIKGLKSRTKIISIDKM